ncbi:MAG: hypothetical protein JM58_02810 [Peptococcaceae bacterium BICA1-8]|nr:MAG: hypothetical protein JM58_02810 [Peptococcaceae bacterium BICA1-8]
MFKKVAIFCFISAILIYAVTIVTPFLIGPDFVFIFLRFAVILFAIGVVFGMIHVINERRQEKKKEDWDKLKDY